MNETLFLYGSGRSAATRTQRRESFPREQQTRVGPWIVRPARSVAVRRELLAKHLAELITKVTNGTVQVKDADGAVIPLQDIPALFADVAPDYGSMSEGELHDLLRGEQPTVAMLRALMMKTPVEARREIGQGYKSIIELLAGSEPNEFHKLANELEAADVAHREKKYTEEQAESDRVAQEAAEQETRAKAEAEAQAYLDAQKASTLPAPPAADDPDKMDFTKKAPEEAAVDATKHEVILEQLKADESVPSEQVQEHIDSVVDAITTDTADVSSDAAAASDAGLISETAAPAKVEGRELPEGWRGLSNGKMADLIVERGITMPEKKNKTALTEALETWLAGS